MLSAARAITRANPEAKLIGVNVGKLGFLSEHPPEEIDALLDELAANKLTAEARLMLSARVSTTSDQPVRLLPQSGEESEHSVVSAAQPGSLLALNEIVIDNYGSTRMLQLEVFVGTALLGVIRADGSLDGDALHAAIERARRPAPKADRR